MFYLFVLLLRLRAPVFAASALLELVSPSAVELQADQDSLDREALKTYLQNLDPEDFGKFTP